MCRKVRETQQRKREREERQDNMKEREKPERQLENSSYKETSAARMREVACTRLQKKSNHKVRLKDIRLK